MIDPTNLTDGQLRLLIGKRGMPASWTDMKAAQIAQRLAAVAEFKRRKAEDDRLHADRANQETEKRRGQAIADLPKFTSVRDMLLGLPPAPGSPRLKALGMKPLDGKALLEDYAEAREAAREAMRVVADRLDIDVDTLLKMDPESVENRGGVSASVGDLVVKGFTNDWKQGEKLIKDAYGVDPPAINRSYGGTHPRKKRKPKS